MAVKYFLFSFLLVPLQLWSQDTIPPVISNFWSDGDSIGVFSSYHAQMPKYSVVDDTDGDITAQAQIIGSVDSSKVGSYQLSIVATDKASNTAKITVNIQVVDTTAPRITLNGANPVCVSLGKDHTDPGVSVNDNYATGTDLSIEVGSSLVNTDSSGWFCITYRATDLSGNKSAILYRTVYVDLVDNGKPCDFIPGKVCGKDVLSVAAYHPPSIDVYPNPSTGIVSVQSEHTLSHLEVFTLTGQRIIDINTQSSSIKLKLPSKGGFYLIAHSDKGMFRKLVIVE